MTYETPWMKLTVRFDVDQISNQLDYTFTSSDDTADPTHGRYMGGVYFHQGQHVYLEVIGTGGPASNFSSFQITDCAIISLPLLTQLGAPPTPTLYSPPSPFLESVGAVYPFPLEFTSSVLLQDGVPVPMRTIRQDWKRSLNVGHTGGRWELSFVITVMILRGEFQAPEMRVFSFDPEGSVGGWTPPE